MRFSDFGPIFSQFDVAKCKVSCKMGKCGFPDEFYKKIPTRRKYYIYFYFPGRNSNLCENFTEIVFPEWPVAAGIFQMSRGSICKVLILLKFCRKSHFCEIYDFGAQKSLFRLKSPSADPRRKTHIFLVPF